MITPKDYNNFSSYYPEAPNKLKGTVQCFKNRLGVYVTFPTQAQFEEAQKFLGSKDTFYRISKMENTLEIHLPRFLNLYKFISTYKSNLNSSATLTADVCNSLNTQGGFNTSNGWQTSSPSIVRLWYQGSEGQNLLPDHQNDLDFQKVMNWTNTLFVSPELLGGLFASKEYHPTKGWAYSINLEGVKQIVPDYFRLIGALRVLGQGYRDHSFAAAEPLAVYLTKDLKDENLFLNSFFYKKP